MINPKLKFTKRRNGLEMCTLWFPVHLTREDLEAVGRRAAGYPKQYNSQKVSWNKIRELIGWAISDGVYGFLVSTSEGEDK